MTLIEVIVAMFVLTMGILSTFTVFNSSGRSVHVSETREAEVHTAQRELERLQSLPYNQLGLTTAPSGSPSPSNPGYYVTSSPSGACPSFQWNQSPGASDGPEPLVVDNCVYNGNTFTTGTVVPSATRSDSQSTYTVYDYVSWVSDSVCLPGVGCPLNNDYKRLTVEVVNASPTSVAPALPVLVSAIVTDPHQLPIVGNPNAINPLDSTNVTCANGAGQQVTCNNGLGNQTANNFYLTNSPESGTYSPPSANNSCMHYTDQLVPTSCGGTGLPATCVGGALPVLTGCPAPDLLNSSPPPSSIPQEYNFSPNLSANTSGRVILRDPKATSCGAAPSNDSSMSEFWATKPLSTQLNLSGSGGMTLYTSTLHGLAVNATLCVGLFLETPALGMLDPLNLLGSSDSTSLGVVAYSMTQWPSAPTPLSFTFNYMGAARLAAAGSSIGVRLWVTSSSGDDLVVQYDGPNAISSVAVNSQ